MLFSKMYDQNQFAPEGSGNYWYVWCESGANKVLERYDYTKIGVDDEYIINFANGAYADTHVERPLWKTMLKISEDFHVQVFPFFLTAKAYVDWDGSPDALHKFDAIKITRKPDAG